MTTGKELVFIAKCLEWREENTERTVSIYCGTYGVSAFLHATVGRFCEEAYANKEGSLERAIQKVKEFEEKWEEALEEQKSAIFSDVEQSGITVGTNA